MCIAYLHEVEMGARGAANMWVRGCVGIYARSYISTIYAAVQVKPPATNTPKSDAQQQPPPKRDLDAIFGTRPAKPASSSSITPPSAAKPPTASKIQTDSPNPEWWAQTGDASSAPRVTGGGGVPGGGGGGRGEGGRGNRGRRDFLLFTLVEQK